MIYSMVVFVVTVLGIAVLILAWAWWRFRRDESLEAARLARERGQSRRETDELEAEIARLREKMGPGPDAEALAEELRRKGVRIRRPRGVGGS